MAKKSLLDSIDVPAPCPKSWDAMTGDNKARVCASCEKDVHNISGMTRGEVKKLLFQSNESVCIRMEKDADGRIKTLKRQFHQITRQIPMAAGILSASLTFSTVASAQKKPPQPRVGKMAVSQSVKDAKAAASISGTVKDVQDAIIPNAQIVLRDTKSELSRKTKSNDEGFYEFKNLESGVYELTAESPGFKKAVYHGIEIESDKNLQLAVTLELGKIEVVGLYAESPEINELSEIKVSGKIQTRQMEPLPSSNRNMTVLGLFPAAQLTPPNKTNAKNKNLSQISFTIFDQIGAIVLDETVSLTNQKTNEKFTALTNQDGVAQFNSIPRGRYNLVVSGNGFEEYRQIIQISQSVESNIEITLSNPNSQVMGDFVIDWSETPLFRAIAQDDNEAVKRLIKTGFSINTKDESGLTALHVAVQHGNLEIVRFLLDEGAKVSVKDKSKRTPLAMLFDSFEDDEKINREIIRLLVAKGANINVKDEDDQTFLMRDSEDDNLEGVKFLLESGANPNVKDKDGETAFDKTDSEEIKQMLRRYGASQ